jgi:hypothetical protein
MNGHQMQVKNSIFHSGNLIFGIMESGNITFNNCITQSENLFNPINNDSTNYNIHFNHCLLKTDSCYGGTEGSFSIQPQNGAPPFQWLWDNGSTQPQRSNLGPGIYTGMITDTLNCSISWSLPLSEPDSITIATTITAATGPAQANGSASLLPQGGVPPYTLLWSNGSTGLSIQNVLPGDYTAYLTDNNGCSSIQTLTVGWVSRTNETLEEVVKIAPNPVNQWLIVSGKGSFYLTDAQGREVKQQILAGNPTTIWVGDLPSGIYFWRLGGSSGRLVKYEGE